MRIAIARGQSDALDGRGNFCSRGSFEARMAESAVSSPNRRPLETIMNCSAQLYSTRSTVSGDSVYCEKTEGGCQKRTTSSLMYVSDAS